MEYCESEWKYIFTFNRFITDITVFFTVQVLVGGYSLMVCKIEKHCKYHLSGFKDVAAAPVLDSFKAATMIV